MVLSPSRISTERQILQIFSQKECMMAQIFAAFATLSCAAQVITTGVSTSQLKSLALCLLKQHITLRCPVPASSRFLLHTFPSASWKLSPVSWLLDAISYLVWHPLFLCRLLWAILYGGCSYAVYSYWLSLTLDSQRYLRAHFISHLQFLEE